tara:strand:- start:1547 stop:2017 length:471 start_codon:yes stop_codon:yes gene_type:complete
MSITKKLQTLNLESDTMITLTYSEGTDVFVHNETAIDTAISETDVISQFSELVATPGISAIDSYGNNIMNNLRDSGLLEGYARDFTFADYLTEALSENFYDQEFIDSSVQQYDHKRGFCTLEATVRVPLANFITANPHAGNWTVTVPTENGVLTLS